MLNVPPVSMVTSSAIVKVFVGCICKFPKFLTCKVFPKPLKFVPVTFDGFIVVTSGIITQVLIVGMPTGNQLLGLFQSLLTVPFQILDLFVTLIIPLLVHPFAKLAFAVNEKFVFSNCARVGFTYTVETGVPEV